MVENTQTMSTGTVITLSDDQKQVQKAFHVFWNKFVVDKNEFLFGGKNATFSQENIKTAFEDLNGKTKLEDIFPENPTSEKDKTNKAIYAHCYWLMRFYSGLSKDNFAKTIKWDKINDNGIQLFDLPNIASIGMTLSHPIPSIRFILLWMLQIKTDNNKIEQVTEEKSEIESGVNAVIQLREGSDLTDNVRACFKELNINENLKFDNAISNILLYLCKPTHYLNIVSQSSKEAICKAFNSEFNEDYLVKKRNEVNEQLGINKTNPFWDKSVLPLWQGYDNKGGDISDIQRLKIKKAMILYGPPGTSKSYDARMLAESIIADYQINDKKTQAMDVLRNMKSNEYDKYIYRLQLHPNYTYDDFIIGKTISDNGKIVVENGYLLNLIDEIEHDQRHDQCPHVLILDEINRVDISRVFGELLTAMEPGYRNKSIDLSIGKKKINVPSNLYFIGTMNQIDFSLEQVDFALRRRFAWKLCTYDSERLREIINQKNNDQKNNAFPNNIDDFISRCNNLNKIIADASDLGPNYVIGQAVFADIVDIINNGVDKKNAPSVLWEISLLPTLEAYCGVMDANSKSDFLKKCKNAFLPQPKEKNKHMKQS